jgi:hypothetical protein
MLLFSPAQAEQSRARLNIFFGGYAPTGDLSYFNGSFDFELGAHVGVDFTYFINDYFGVGAYFEGMLLSTEDLYGYDSSQSIYFTHTIDARASIIGVSATGRAPIGSIANFFGSARVGAAFTKVELTEDTYLYDRTVDSDSVSPAFSLEGGISFKPYIWDFGFILRYTYIPTIEDDFNNLSVNQRKYKADISGASILFNTAVNF